MKEYIREEFARRLEENIQDKKAKAAAKDILLKDMPRNKAIQKYGVSPKKLDKFLKDLRKDMLGESTKTVDDFMKTFKIKNEPKKGSRLNFEGYPLDYDGFEEDEIYLNAVDNDAARGAEKAFKKKGWNVLRVGTELTLDVS